MARPRKSTAEHERSGSFEKHPERKAARANEPKPDGPLGTPPACFDPNSYTGEKLLAIWHELVLQAPPGVLTSADRAHLELACRLYHRVRSNPNAKVGDYNRLAELLGKMGMNPSDRSKVNIAPNIPSSTVKPNDERNSGHSNVFEQLAAEEDKATIQ